MWQDQQRACLMWRPISNVKSASNDRMPYVQDLENGKNVQDGDTQVWLDMYIGVCQQRMFVRQQTWGEYVADVWIHARERINGREWHWAYTSIYKTKDGRAQPLTFGLASGGAKLRPHLACLESEMLLLLLYIGWRCLRRDVRICKDDEHAVMHA